MDRSKGLAYCGLGCCVCGENADCAGCRMDGCVNKDWCGIKKCCEENKRTGCWECSDFPCGDQMFKKTRVRAFVRFIKEYGEETLMDALEKGEKAGMRYHYAGQLTGDYDQLGDEEAIIEKLRSVLND